MIGQYLSTIKKRGEDVLVFKYPLFNYLFQEDYNLLKWPFSERILVTAFDIYKDPSLYSHLTNTDQTLKEYLQDAGLRKSVKIFADTGIYELEAKKSRTDLSAIMGPLPQLTPSEIFNAYDIIDPDFLVAPDEIILLGDDIRVRRSKLELIRENFNRTLEIYDHKKIFPTLQGVTSEEMISLIHLYKENGMNKIARGGLLPLRKRDRRLYYDILKLSEKIARENEISYLHAFGLSGIYALGEFFVHNTYDSIDTSMIYWISADQRYLQSNGYIIPVRRAKFARCHCKGCYKMDQSKRYPQSGRFMAALYFHNASQCRDLLSWIFDNPKEARMRYPLYLPSSTNTSIQSDPISRHEFEFIPANTLELRRYATFQQDPDHHARVSVINHWDPKRSHRILIISGCTKRKKFLPIPEAICDQVTHVQRLEELANRPDIRKIEAKDLYRGIQHKKVMKSINLLNRFFNIDHYILSAGFGLIPGSKEIISYDSTFKNKPADKIKQLTDMLGIEDQIRSIDFSVYSSVFFILGPSYLSVINRFVDTNVLLPELVAFDTEGTSYNLGSFRTFVKLGLLPYYLGKNYEIRGNILLEYAYWIRKMEGPHSFAAFWHSLTQCPCTDG